MDPRWATSLGANAGACHGSRDPHIAGAAAPSSQRLRQCKSSNGLIAASLRSNGPAASLNSSTSSVLCHFWKVIGVSRGQARSWPLMRVRTEKGSPQPSLLPHRYLLKTPVRAPPLQLPVSCTRAQTRARGLGPFDRN